MSELAITDKIARRFWSKIDKGSPDQCWPWLGWRNAEGYGRFDVRRSKPLATHIVLQLDGRPRPSPKHLALHGDGCAPICTNPAHLRWGFGKENADDRDRLGRRKPACGERHGNAKLTDEVVSFIRCSSLTQAELGRRFGLSRIWVGKIKRRQVWQHLA